MKKYYVNDFDGVTTGTEEIVNAIEEAKELAKKLSREDSNNKVYRVDEIEADTEEDFVNGDYENFGTYFEYQNGEEV